MCGISGFYSLDGALKKEDLLKMTKVLQHRGPDSEGFFFDDTAGVGLGHRRLSILDLSENASQPMYSSSGKNVIIFNGEVYNFKEIAEELNVKLKTTSDTEVILEAFEKWGESFVHRLNGMFAFAIYNFETKVLYIYRDRLGIKPLYYYWDGVNFVFSSELKALKALNFLRKKLSINLKAISLYLNLGYIPRPYSIFNEISKLESGSILKLGSRGFEISSYWKLEEKIRRNIGHDFYESKERLSNLITSSVRYRLISDVPFGTFLSGGVDSSLITAVAQSLSMEPIKTFSIGFAESKFNESIHAKKIANYLKTDHFEFLLTYKDAMEYLPKIVDVYDEPYADSSAIPTMLVSKMATRQVKMTLSGDGGDELFFGYNMYNWAERLSNPLIKSFRKPIGYLLSLLSDKYKRASQLFFYEGKEKFKSHIFSQEQYLFSSKELENQLIPNFYYFDSNLEKLDITRRKLGAIEAQSVFDLKYYLQDDLLVKVDRASMINSLETRVPLLDYRIVEEALNISPNFKRKSGISKFILKEILFDYVPPSFFDRPKWGFSIPLSTWLNRELRYLIEDNLNEQVINRFSIVNFEYVKELKARFYKGESYLYNRLWQLIVLHLWLIDNEK